MYKYIIIGNDSMLSKGSDYTAARYVKKHNPLCWLAKIITDSQAYSDGVLDSAFVSIGGYTANSVSKSLNDDLHYSVASVDNSDTFVDSEQQVVGAFVVKRVGKSVLVMGVHAPDTLEAAKFFCGVKLIGKWLSYTMMTLIATVIGVSLATVYYIFVTKRRR